MTRNGWLGAALGLLCLGAVPARAASPGAAPTSLRADRANPSQIQLHWFDNSTDETGFRIERKTGRPTDSGTFVEITSVSANVTGFFDTLSTPETFFTYRVRGSLSGGRFTGYSNTSAASTPPAAPTNLRLEITGARPTGQVIVRLTWQDNSAVETGFRLERREASAPANAFLVVGNAAANATTATDPTASGNKSYVYRVRATDGDLLVFSAATNEVTVRTSSPSAPTSLVAVAVNSANVKLTWNFAAAGQSGFTIRRRTASDPVSEIADVGFDIRSFNDTTVSPNTVYFYTVVAFNGLGDSAASNEDSAAVMAAPTGLAGRALNGNQITLSWNDNSLDLETGFEILRGTTGLKLARIATTGANVREFADTQNLAVNTTYHYRVRAKNNVGDLSSQSNAISVTTLNSPAGMSAFAPDSESVLLRWSDRSAGESGFRVERKPAAPGESAEWTEIAVVGPNVTEAVDVAADPGTRYSYRVRAFNADGDSEYCSEWPTLIPLARTQITLAVQRGLRVALAWTDIDGEDGYVIERRVSAGRWEVIGTTAADQTRFVDTLRSVFGRLRYRIRAANPHALATYSDVALPR